MPRKIGFTVVSSSGHEENFSAKELMVHAPTVNGWRSPRRCPYPQHITLQLTERCRVRKLQLLAHQYMISAKVEFHIGDSVPGAQTPGSPGSPGLLRRLGYVSLSDNEKTGFKARELKSVHVDAVGTYLRITFHANHVNSYNVYSQVALVAINVLGDSVDSNAFNTIPSREQLIEHYLHSTPLDTALDTTAYMGKCESVSPLDDLAFDMYQDPEVAQLIRLLDQRKQDMVRQENFDAAKGLKQAIADLHKVGERLGRYDVEKHRAVEKEDFDLAKTKKEQMEAYRTNVYQQLELHNLLDMSMIARPSEPPSPAAREPAPPPPSSSVLLSSPPSRPPAAKPKPKPRVSTETTVRRTAERKPEPPHEVHELNPAATTTAAAAASSSQAAAIPPPTSQPTTTTTTTPREPALVPRVDVSGDERPLPALHRKDGPGEAPQSSAEDLGLPPEPQGTPRSPGRTWEPEPLTETAQREASLAIEVYGDGLVAGAYSKSWSYREDALLAVYKKLSEVQPSGTSKEELRNMIRAAVFLVKKALPDQVPSVFQASLKLLRLLLGQMIPGLGPPQGGGGGAAGRAEASHCLEQTWPNLLARSGDRASRLRAAAIAFILEIALLKEVRALQSIPGELAKPFKSNLPTRLALSRAELLEKLLAELGTDNNSGFTLDSVMKFCTGALEHRASSEVRELAVRIVLATYQRHRGAVLRYLPPNDAATRRNVLYKNIFDGFARIDGKPVETQTVKNGTHYQHRQQEGEKEKQEIRSLQEQLASLKEISEKGKGTTEGQTQGKGDREVKGVLGKAAVEKSPPNTSPDEVKEQPSDANYLDKLCIFCGKADESFTEDGLDLHYWKHCPMLHRCAECRQVVEIASLTEHLVGECESRAGFGQCPRCTEAVPADELASHAQGPNCNPPVLGKGSNHCPLCHNNFMPGEEAWKAHLMGREGCKQNSRRTVVAQRTQPAQGKPVASGAAKLKQAWSVGARGRPMGRGSRIPALAPRTSRNQASRHAPGKR